MSKRYYLIETTEISEGYEVRADAIEIDKKRVDRALDGTPVRAREWHVGVGRSAAVAAAVAIEQVAR